MRPTTAPADGAPAGAPRHDRPAALAVGGVWPGLGRRAAGVLAEIARSGSNVEWVGTFVWILWPVVLTGVLLGWAEHVRRGGGRREPAWPVSRTGSRPCGRQCPICT